MNNYLLWVREILNKVYANFLTYFSITVFVLISTKKKKKRRDEFLQTNDTEQNHLLHRTCQQLNYFYW